jgi:hypothetical protein
MMIYHFNQILIMKALIVLFLLLLNLGVIILLDDVHIMLIRLTLGADVVIITSLSIDIENLKIQNFNHRKK